jgi:hypothetical protein
VLDAIARALQLDAERAHLVRLAHEADGSTAILRPRRRPKQWTVRPGLQWSLDAITSPSATDRVVGGAQTSRRGSVGHRSDAQAGQLSNDAGGGGSDDPCNSAGVGGVKEARNRS